MPMVPLCLSPFPFALVSSPSHTAPQRSLRIRWGWGTGSQQAQEGHLPFLCPGGLLWRVPGDHCYPQFVDLELFGEGCDVLLWSKLSSGSLLLWSWRGLEEVGSSPIQVQAAALSKPLRHLLQISSHSLLLSPWVAGSALEWEEPRRRAQSLPSNLACLPEPSSWPS